MAVLTFAVIAASSVAATALSTGLVVVASLGVVELGVFMLDVVVLGVFMLDVVVLGVFMLGVVVLGVVVAATLGAVLQLAVQLPTVLVLLGRLRPSLDLASARVRQVFRSFGPVVVARGVVQISAYVDQVLASLLPTGAVAGLAYAQLIYTLPVSLFGMSVSASELPEMARSVASPALLSCCIPKSTASPQG